MSTNTSKSTLETAWVWEQIETMPVSDTQIVRDAIHRCQDFAKESIPNIFLTYAQGDRQEAIRKINTFWQLRRQVFGADRCFQTLLDLSGQGCLSQDDIHIARQGFLAETLTDSQGRPVLLYDVHRGEPNQDAQARARFLFFMLVYLAIHRPTSSTKGVVLVKMIDDAKSTLQPSFLTDIYQCMPMNLQEHAVTYHVPNTETTIPSVSQNTLSHLSSTTPRIVPRNRQSSPEGPGTATLSEESLVVLKSAGIPREALPPHLGGTWKLRFFQVWFSRLLSSDASFSRRQFVVPTHMVACPASRIMTNDAKDGMRTSPGTKSAKRRRILDKIDAVYRRQRLLRVEEETLDL